MSEPAISVRGVRKRYGATVAVDDLSFDVHEGSVTGFLGPNGAGKTTTIRVLLGLAEADSGEALVRGVPYRGIEQPARVVGTLIDGAGFHPGRTAKDHLRVLAEAGSIAPSRVEEVLDTVQLTGAAERKVGGFSLGMRRRLGLACALLGEPDILVLDEPANGLDPPGIRWLRESLRSFAASGGTVLVSSHVLAEIAQTADDVVVINHGRLVTQTTVESLTAGRIVSVRSPSRDRLQHALVAEGASAEATGVDGLLVSGLSQEQVGDTAAAEGIALHELVTRGESLEDVFLQMVDEGDDVAAG